MAGKTLKSKLSNLPNSAGIYLFYGKNKRLLYVGKSIAIRKRVMSYFSFKNSGPKTKMLVNNILDIKFIKVFSEFEAVLLEAELIKKHQPFYNIQAKDDKTPLYIKISNETIPLITLSRKIKKQNKVFLVGPFASTKTTKEILRIIRKIFPYCQHMNPKKPCLYVHLGLCPYPYLSEDNQKIYKDNIKNIKKLLNGKISTLRQHLTVKMKSYSNMHKYEKANEIKSQINKIELLLNEYHIPNDFLDQPTLVDDLTYFRLKDLKKVCGLKNIPKRMECYDISNILGKDAAGSMVVFENGTPAKHLYRKFKIKFNSQDDYQMIKEVISRRIKNKWPLADLIIIDGGRGQLNSAISALDKSSLSIPVISLAKKYEEIYVPNRISPILLPQDRPARQILESIRNEAHRFALSYHRLLRSKILLESVSNIR